MSSIGYVLLYCACGEVRKAAPEKVYEPGLFDFPRLRASLKCPACAGQMRVAPEYGEPMYCGQAFWPVSADVEWMA
jgi:hypothetical protein